MKVVNKKHKSKNTTDMTLLVESITKEDVFDYDENRIVESLVNETECPLNIAKDIASTVTKRLQKLELKTITPSLIRSFVNVSLYEKGFDKELKSDTEIVLPISDLESMIECENNENGNTPHNPESINLSIAEYIMKQYALKKVFSKDVTEFHLSGDGHIHDMGMIDRLYCSGHSPEYIKKHGLKNIPNIPSTSSPANSAEVLARHLSSATLFFTSLFAGAIGYDAINMYFSPLLKGYTYKQMKQLAQTFMFDFSQLAGAKGGQVSFTDLNLYATTPEHYKDVLAMGKSGQYMAEDNLGDIHYFKTQEETKEYATINKCKALTYADFENESLMFVRAMLEVSLKGDAMGLPFGFPKLHLHINDKCYDNPKSNALIGYASEVLSKMGNPYIDFDRNAMSMSQCCRLVLEFTDEDKLLLSTPEEIRFVGGQCTSVNLANLPLKVGTNEDDIYKEVDRRMNLVVKSHQQRLAYIKHLCDLPNSPLKFYTCGMDKKPYVRFDRISWLVGIVGLNEYVWNLTGQQLHESKEAFIKGVELITYMSDKCKELSKQFNMNFKLEETPAESTAGRFAKLDIKKYEDKALHQENELGVYYTNSIHFNVDNNLDYIDILQEQSKFHPLVEAGSMIHCWVGDRSPNKKAIYDLIKNTWNNTKCAEMTITPDKTTCSCCNKTFNGFLDKCPDCGSESLKWTTRITGYQVVLRDFDGVTKINDSKNAEIKDRTRKSIR